MATPLPPLARRARLGPVTQLAGRVRRRLAGGGRSGDSLSIWLLKTALRYASRRKVRARSRHDPEAWRRAWERGDGTDWPAQPVTGVIESADGRIVIDRCDITAAGHLLLEGWALGIGANALRLEADRCSIEWQATFAVARPDVVQAFQLPLVGRDAHVGVQLMARISDYVPRRSRLALTARGEHSVGVVVPVVPRIERSGSVWHSVYDSMRHRGPRDVAYLETSVRMLKDLRKADWRERSAAICGAIDEAMPDGPELRILVLSRLHPNVAYLNLHLLAAARRQPARFIVCSMGQAAIQRASEYRIHVATVGGHEVRFVNAEIGTPTSELIERFALSCGQRRCPGLVVYDDVAVASAMASLTEALRHDRPPATAWPREVPDAGPAKLPFSEPLAANDGPGPYWRSAKAMEHGGLGAVLFDPAAVDIPAIPPFEGRGYALEYLLKSAIPDATLSGEAMLDLLDPAGQREAQGLDMLMLMAS